MAASDRELERAVEDRVRKARWDTVTGIAWALRIDADRVQPVVDRLVKLRVLTLRDDGALVIKPRRNTPRSAPVWARIAAHLAEHLDQVDGWTTAAEIAPAIGAPVKQVSMVLARQAERGKLRRRDGDRGRAYLYSLVPGADRLRR